MAFAQLITEGGKRAVCFAPFEVTRLGLQEVCIHDRTSRFRVLELIIYQAMKLAEHLFGCIASQKGASHEQISGSCWSKGC